MNAFDQPRYGSKGQAKQWWYKLLRNLRVHYGRLFEIVKGPSITEIHHGRNKSAVEQLRPNTNDPDVDLLLEAKETIYVTRYKRWWIPDRKRSIYEVQGSVNPAYRHLFDDKLFEPATYPMLCHLSLRGTRYPHLYAMLAYLNRVYPIDHPFRSCPDTLSSSIEM